MRLSVNCNTISHLCHCAVTHSPSTAAVVADRCSWNRSLTLPSNGG